MSEKRLDAKNRWRNVVVAFRMSPEEAQELNVKVSLSGLSKLEVMCMADGNRRYRSDKKLYKVSFKLSEEDKRLLEEGAQKAGMNISEYLRNLVRGGGNVDASFTTDRGIFIRQITGIATNVNQIAKVVNTQGYGYTRDILAVKQDLEDVKRLMREVLTVWQSLRYSA